MTSQTSALWDRKLSFAHTGDDLQRGSNILLWFSDRLNAKYMHARTHVPSTYHLNKKKKNAKIFLLLFPSKMQSYALLIPIQIGMIK